MPFGRKHTAVLTGLMMITGCAPPNPRVTTKLNGAAALKGELPFSPLQFKVITTLVDQKDSTMSTLFGNELAVDYARAHAGHDYPGGCVVAYVTWQQQEDERWFGAKIPSVPKQVEIAVVGSSGEQMFSYERYAGTPLKKVFNEQGPVPNERTMWMLTQRAAVMP